MMERPTLRSAFALAWPASLAAMVTPLLGLVDSAVLARAAGPAEIAGVAMGAAIISLLYWPFAFLRMGTAGLVAQAEGRGDEAGLRAHLVQGLVLGLGLGCIIALLSPLVATVGPPLMADTAVTEGALAAAATYLSIRLLAAPFALAFYAGVGWLTGQGRTRLMMVAVIAGTLLNGVLDVVFVLGMGMGVFGIALGTALAELATCLLVGLAALAALHRRGGLRLGWVREKLTENWRGIMSLNSDIFVRTLLIAASFVWFVRAGTPFGDVTVAANQILFQVVMVTGLALDGPAIAAESLVGRALGRREGARAAFVAAVGAVARVTAIAAVALSAGLLAFEPVILETLIPAGENPVLRPMAADFYIYAALSPLIVAAPFFLDGVYVGATRGAVLRNTMILSFAGFGATLLILRPVVGNHGVWLAYAVFMMVRAGSLIWCWRAVLPPAPAEPAGGVARSLG